MILDKNLEEKVDAIEEEDDTLGVDEEKGFTDGVVANCANLNIRKKPDKDADILKVVPEGEEVVIDVKDNTDKFYNVILKDGTEGFAMKEYIKLV